MFSMRTGWLSLWLAATFFTASAQVSVDHYRDDGSRYVCSAQDVLYDDFFHAARFAVAATADAAGLVTFTLEVTYDEGMLKISRGDSLTLVLRGGDNIVLKANRDVTRADILKRHYLTYNDYYITCYYAMSTYDIQRITRNRVTKLTVNTSTDFSFDRKIDKFQDRFRRQFTSVYRYLMGQ